MNRKETAHLMARGSEKIRRLTRANESLGERMELVYAMLRHSGAIPRHGGTMGMEECTATALEKASRELLAEDLKDQEPLHYPGRADGVDPNPNTTDTFISEMRSLGRDVTHASDAALLAKDQGTRNAFIHTLFNRLQAFQKRLAGLDLRGPQ